MEAVSQRSKTEMGTNMLTVRDAAEQLQVSAACVYRIVQSGRLPCYRIGNGRGTVRIAEEDLAEYVSACRVEKTNRVRRAPRSRLKHIKV